MLFTLFYYEKSPPDSEMNDPSAFLNSMELSMLLPIFLVGESEPSLFELYPKTLPYGVFCCPLLLLTF